MVKVMYFFHPATPRFCP